MAKIVFRLNGVPEDEADQVRQLLTDNQIDFYETDAGRWGFSVAAIWLHHDEEFEQARELIDAFQQSHVEHVRQQFAEDKAAGRVPTFWQLLRTNPTMVVLYWALIIVVVMFSIMPVYHFFNG